MVTQPDHGTRACYAAGCRRPECVEANAEYMRAYRQRRGYAGQKRALLKHGTRSCYVAGCRRPECAEANRVYQRQKMREYRGGTPMNDEWIDDALR